LIADVSYELLGRLCTIAGALRAIHAISSTNVQYLLFLYSYSPIKNTAQKLRIFSMEYIYVCPKIFRGM
jgi:hypothetical protein